MPDPQMIEVNADDLRRVLDLDGEVPPIGAAGAAVERLRAALPEPEPRAALEGDSRG